MEVVKSNRIRKPAMKVPRDPWEAFAFLVSRCGEGFGNELMASGKTDTQARNIIVGCFLDFAAGESCRVARREGREPEHKKWRTATDDAFKRAVARTAKAKTPMTLPPKAKRGRG